MSTAPDHARDTVAHAFLANPSLPWTPNGLAIWYGIRIDRVGVAIRELVIAGLVRTAAERAGSYVLVPKNRRRPDAPLASLATMPAGRPRVRSSAG